MIHLFIKYTNDPDSHECSLSLLTFVRDIIIKLNETGNYVMIHKLTNNMLSDTKILAELKERGIEELPTLLDGETSSVVIGVDDIKRFLNKILNTQQKPQPPQQNQYREPEIPQHDMLSDDGKGDDMFDESKGMMDLYKTQLTRRPNMAPPNGRKSKLQQPPQIQKTNEQSKQDNVYEPTNNDTKKSIAKAYGEGDEDNDLLSKLMDNLGADSY